MQLHRRVFFIAGFDPKSPRYYHQLYRALARQRPPGSEGADGPPVTVSARRSVNDWADEWSVSWPGANGASPRVTRYTLLRWDDIVRTHWSRGPWTVWRDHWLFYVDGWRQGFFRRVWKGSRRNWAFVMFPFALLMAWGLLWLALATGVVGVLPASWPAAVPAAVAAVAVLVAGWSWHQVSHRLGTDWLVRLYGFSHAQAAGEIHGLEERVEAMAALIAEAASSEGPQQELLVIGHSAGASLAASALARALRLEPALGQRPPELGLLTLGHCIPLVSFFATASALRKDLDALTAHAPLTWIDYTAPADWAGCAQISPWGRTGRARLQRLSPRFPRILDPARYRALRRNRMEMHMQYLKPADHAGGYDLLALTAGGATLRERHPQACAATP
jgi:hypothetical protein